MNTKLVALQNRLSSKTLFDALILQLNKDFYLANIDFSFDATLTFNQLYSSLANKISDIFNNEYDTYLNLIYRIDLSEKKLLNIKTNDVEEVIKSVTLLVLEREIQKILLRFKFQ